MIELKASEISPIVSTLVRQANLTLPADIKESLTRAFARESDPTGKIILGILLENLEVADSASLPICQDTGIDVIFVTLGQDIAIKGDLMDAINSGVREGTEKGLLRRSVCDPITRKNTGDNTPAVVHIDLIPGNRVEISVLPKGCGSENMSCLKMLPPSAGIDGVINEVVERIRTAGPNPCPPGIVGIGLGGTMEKAAILSKKALLRPIGLHNSREDIAEIEKRILEELNRSGIGPLGLGGKTTTLAVAMETYPCHIASLPLAINVQCHAARRATGIWEKGQWKLESSYHISVSEGPDSGPDRLNAIKNMAKRVELPLTHDKMKELKAGDWVLLSGWLLAGRDQTHRKLIELMKAGKPLPVDFSGQLIYYVGPSPAPQGRPVGSAGPTTSYRMDKYTPSLLDLGLAATMGKGKRSKEVRSSLKRHSAIYLATLGGAGAYLAERITACEIIAFEELGPEALFRMKVKDFPAIVINDIAGRDYYEEVMAS